MVRTSLASNSAKKFKRIMWTPNLTDGPFMSIIRIALFRALWIGIFLPVPSIAMISLHDEDNILRLNNPELALIRCHVVPF